MAATSDPASGSLTPIEPTDRAGELRWLVVELHGGVPPVAENPLDSLWIRHRALARHVAGVHCRFRLEQEDMRLLLSDGQVLHTFWDDDEPALADVQVAVAQPDGEIALEHEEQLIFGLMGVPDELALHLHDLDVRVVQLADDLRAPLLAAEAEP